MKKYHLSSEYQRLSAEYLQSGTYDDIDGAPEDYTIRLGKWRIKKHDPAHRGYDDTIMPSRWYHSLKPRL